MVLSPRLAASGLTVATLGHFALSAVFALNLQAVASTELSWAQMAWTVPAITTISCLPFTVAGAGVREIAAVTLLGLYAVPAADAVAASMLTMVHKLAWAGIGAGVLWREQSMQERSSHVRPSVTVSIHPSHHERGRRGRRKSPSALGHLRVQERIVVAAKDSCGGLSTVRELGGRVVNGGASRRNSFEWALQKRPETSRSSLWTASQRGPARGCSGDNVRRPRDRRLWRADSENRWEAPQPSSSAATA